MGGCGDGPLQPRAPSLGGCPSVNPGPLRMALQPAPITALTSPFSSPDASQTPNNGSFSSPHGALAPGSLWPRTPPPHRLRSTSPPLHPCLRTST